jgi:23S rRNA pseudouridine1911/1915/1917 synthase
VFRLLSVRLLYCDSALAVCEKPVGVSSESPGLPDMVREQEGFAALPVHRLDKTTGGACVLARSPRACAALQALFQQDRVLKEYLAVVSGVPETREGSFTDLLYHDPRTCKTFIADRPRKGVKEASCEWTLLETADTPDGPLSLVRVRLHTGRTHQIRVQFASRRMPLAGDRRYGSRIKAPAPALWSVRICFPHPRTGAELSFQAPLPEDFRRGLKTGGIQYADL